MKKYLFNVYILGDGEYNPQEHEISKTLCGGTFSVREDGKLSRKKRKGLETYDAELDMPSPHLDFCRRYPIVNGPNLKFSELKTDFVIPRYLPTARIEKRKTNGLGLWLKLNPFS